MSCISRHVSNNRDIAIMFTQCLKYDKGQDGHVLVFVHQAANESRKYIYIYIHIYIYIQYIYTSI